MTQPSNPVMPASGNPPFYYASFSGLWVYYLVDLNKLNKLLSNSATGFQAFDFGGGKGLANINFMNYAGHSGQNDPTAYDDILKAVSTAPGADYPASFGVEPTNECEFNIVCYPGARKLQVPFGMSITDYISGADHTKTIGNFRVGVPCDDRIAVFWGTRNFGENKIMTHPFLFDVPSPNNSGATAWHFFVPGARNEAFEFTYNYADPPARPTFSCEPFMFAMEADVSNLTPFSCNSSEIIDYSMYGDGGPVRPAGSRRNLFGVFQGYDLTKAKPGAMNLTLGNSAHPLVGIMKTILDQAPAVAAQTFHSHPAVAESSMYYVDV